MGNKLNSAQRGDPKFTNININNNNNNNNSGRLITTDSNHANNSSNVTTTIGNNNIINPSLSTHSLEYYYPIRLSSEQSLALFGMWEVKTTLTWKDVLRFPNINLGSCISCGIDNMKLCRMQPDIKEWIRFEKASIKDCMHMSPWKPNPFTDLGCSIGDLVVYRKYLQPKILTACGISFTTLKARYGLTEELMILLRYSLDDWLDLEITEEYLAQIPQDQFNQIFGKVARSEILELAKRRNQYSLLVDEK
jgi:hypothetical protein